jgi:Acetyltransferase (GNAT) domain
MMLDDTLTRGGTATFHVLESAGSARDQWLALLASWPGREVFAHPGYLGLYAQPGDRPVCAVYRCPEGQVIHPLVLRDLRATPFWGPDREEAYDTVSPPYGYGGPFVDGPGDRSVLMARFFREYERWARSQHVVSEYLTCSPKAEAPDPYPGELTVRAPGVVRVLSSPEEIWRDYEGAIRTKVRAAQRAGVTVEFDPCGARAADFLEVWADTIRRQGVPSRYWVSPAFLEGLHAALPGDYVYGHALLDGRVVASELVLISGDSTFFFRGGACAEGRSARSNHLLRHRIILWSQERGKRFYLMGAGITPGDSLYHYKLQFAPRGARPLHVGKWILDHDRYAQLVTARRAHEQARGKAWEPPPDYFPAYRAPSVS